MLTTLLAMPLVADADNAAHASSFIANLGVFGLLTLLPFVAIAATSFVKIVVVLGILRSALGTPSVPPNTVVTALAVVLSIFLMSPVAHNVAGNLDEHAKTSHAETVDPLGLKMAGSLLDAASPPLVAFLEANTRPEEIEFFEGLANSPKVNRHSLTLLIPAFITGELVEAFLIGFLVFLPFLVIDLLISNVLMALGMHMLSPTVISLPLKLLLFTVANGWHLLISGLVVNYTT